MKPVLYRAAGHSRAFEDYFHDPLFAQPAPDDCTACGVVGIGLASLGFGWGLPSEFDRVETILSRSCRWGALSEEVMLRPKHVPRCRLIRDHCHRRPSVNEHSEPQLQVQQAPDAGLVVPRTELVGLELAIHRASIEIGALPEAA